MAETVKHRTCLQAPKCEVAKDGRCLEGLPLTECPHFSWTLEPTVIQPVENTNGQTIPHVVLQSGEEWLLDNLQEITNKYSTRRIFIIGDSDSGKTTLLIRLFNSFQHGPFEDFLFAGSTTILGFERRIHKTKIESYEDEEKTDKTNSIQFSFLHLALKRRDALDKPATHLLLSDISGERLKLARDSSSEMKELDMLRNADFILIFIDGEKIRDRKTRMAAIVRSESFLRQALDDGMILENQSVRIVLSKWDLLDNLDGFNYQAEIVQRFTASFGSRLKHLKFFVTCCRSSEPTQVDSFHGLKDLIMDWSVNKPITIDRSNFSVQPRPSRAMASYFTF